MANNITLSYPSAFYHQFLDKNGKPLTGGKLYTYIAGSTTPVVTYKTISGGTESANRNTNPIILDMAGMAELVIATDTAYKFVLFDKNDAKIAEWDNVTGNIGGGGGGSEDIVVVGTPNEIDVSGSVIQGVKRYVVSLSNSVKITILQLIGLYNNVLNSLGNKADKVHGANAGNLAALDANGNLTDSGSKAADFKTKQTPVTDPSASGAGLDFIDSISQDANGEITPHKKAVQDGTTAQKGVVQLQDSIGSTESSAGKAVTPHAVREAINAAVSSAYHAAGTKSVAQLTSSLLVAENEGCVYNITDSGTTTSDFVDGAGHPINAGDNVGVCDVGGGVYKFDLLSGFVNLTNYLTKTGDASNTTSTFTKASGDTSTMTSGRKLSAIFTAISSFFASLKALAFKDKASYNDLSSGVQSSLDKADSALQSHQSVTDNNPTLAWGATSKVGKVGSTDLRVTMPSNPAQNLPASVITSGTFDAARIPTTSLVTSGDTERVPTADAVYGAIADKPISEYGFGLSYNVSGQYSLMVRLAPLSGQYKEIRYTLYLTQTNASNDSMQGSLTIRIRNQGGDVYVAYATFIRFLRGSVLVSPRVYIDTSGYVYVYSYGVIAGWNGTQCQLTSVSTLDGTRVKIPNYVTFYKTSSPSASVPASQTSVPIDTFEDVTCAYGGVGSTTTPVYVDSNGQVKPCTQGATLKTNTATLYISGYTDNNIPYYNVKDIKNGCVNHVDFSGITNSTCNITFEAPTLATGEEYDYIISLEGYTNNSGYSTGAYVENCKQILHYISDGNVWVGEGLFLQATDWRQICVVRGNTCEWKRVALS